MVDHPQSQLKIIGQLAREYEQKYKDLEMLLSEMPAESVLPQLQALAERTTDRFRAAQTALFSTSGFADGEEGQTALKAATALCSAFDEMRILQQFISNIVEKDEG